MKRTLARNISDSLRQFGAARLSAAVNGFLILLYLIGAGAALVALFAVLALVDNRMNYGSWRKRSGKRDPGGGVP